MCKDCKYYLPVDVFTGICKITRARINPDGEPCEKLELLPRCRYCTHFTPEKDFLGKCMNDTLAYPDMIAAKCADFIWQKN